MLAYEVKVPKRFWRTTIVTAILRRRDFEVRRAIVGIAKTKKILQRLINKLFSIKNTYQDTNQTNQTN